MDTNVHLLPDSTDGVAEPLASILFGRLVADWQQKAPRRPCRKRRTKRKLLKLKTKGL
jgi:hypothetical protein